MKFRLETEEKDSTIKKTNAMLNQAKTLARNFRDSSSNFEKKVAVLQVGFATLLKDQLINFDKFQGYI